MSKSTLNIFILIEQQFAGNRFFLIQKLIISMHEIKTLGYDNSRVNSRPQSLGKQVQGVTNFENLVIGILGRQMDFEFGFLVTKNRKLQWGHTLEFDLWFEVNTHQSLTFSFGFAHIRVLHLAQGSDTLEYYARVFEMRFLGSTFIFSPI